MPKRSAVSQQNANGSDVPDPVNECSGNPAPPPPPRARGPEAKARPQPQPHPHMRAFPAYPPQINPLSATSPSAPAPGHAGASSASDPYAAGAFTPAACMLSPFAFPPNLSPCAHLQPQPQPQHQHQYQTQYQPQCQLQYQYHPFAFGPSSSSFPPLFAPMLPKPHNRDRHNSRIRESEREFDGSLSTPPCKRQRCEVSAHSRSSLPRHDEPDSDVEDPHDAHGIVQSNLFSSDDEDLHHSLHPNSFAQSNSFRKRSSNRQSNMKGDAVSRLQEWCQLRGLGNLYKAFHEEITLIQGRKAGGRGHRRPRYPPFRCVMQSDNIKIKAVGYGFKKAEARADACNGILKKMQSGNYHDPGFQQRWDTARERSWWGDQLLDWCVTLFMHESMEQGSLTFAPLGCFFSHRLASSTFVRHSGLVVCTCFCAGKRPT